MKRLLKRGVIDDLPLHAASPVYRARQAARLLRLGRNRFPLADGHGQLSTQPLLFHSAGRSGTTLLRSMLVAGGEIAIPPQSYVLNWIALHAHAFQAPTWRQQCVAVFDRLDASPAMHTWGFDVYSVRHEAFDMPPEQQSLACLLDLIYRHYAAQHVPTATTWGDQSIENTVRIQWLLNVFPTGKYLHVLRDGRDVAASWVEDGKTPREAADMWLTTLEKDEWLRAHLDPADYLEVRYEDLVAEPEHALRPVCDFAGIEFRSSMLEYWKADTTVEHKFDDRHQNLEKPVFTRSVGRWRERLPPGAQRMVVERLGDALAERGYSTD